MNKENNILIAEFLGYSFENGEFKVPHSDKTSNSDFKEWCPTYWDEVLDSGGYLVAPCNLMFSYDWNWLMSAVEKIENLGYWVQIKRNHCLIEVYGNSYGAKNNGSYFVNSVQWGSSKINATYNAVIEFITWYNSKPKANL